MAFPTSRSLRPVESSLCHCLAAATGQATSGQDSSAAATTTNQGTQGHHRRACPLARSESGSGLDSGAHHSRPCGASEPAQSRRSDSPGLSSERPRHDGLTWAHFKGGLDITVSQGLSQRALRIADALIKHLERVGMEVRVRATSRDGYGYRVPESTHVTEVRCDEEWVGFALRERRSEHREEPDPRKAARGWPWDYAERSYVPNGRLELSLTNPRLNGMRKTWSDGKRQRVEDVLGDFVVHLHLAAAQLKEIRAEDGRRLEARLEAQRRREEAERRRLEKEKLERLTGEAASWQRAKQLREYAQEGQRILAAGEEAEVDATEEQSSSGCSSTPTASTRSSTDPAQVAQRARRRSVTRATGAKLPSGPRGNLGSDAWRAGWRRTTSRVTRRTSTGRGTRSRRAA